jgi:hypothetical protein
MIAILGAVLGLSAVSAVEPRTYDCQVAYQAENGKVVGSAKKTGTTAGAADQIDLSLEDERFLYHFEIVAQTFQIDVTEKGTKKQDVCIKGGSGPYISYQFPMSWTPKRGPAQGLKLRSIELFCTQR